MTGVIAGISGARRNASVALCHGGRILAVCEQERLTRTRRAGLQRGRLPSEAIGALLADTGYAPSDVRAYAVAEPDFDLPAGVKVERLPHHFAHALTAFQTSGFPDALIVICDRSSEGELSVWRGEDGGLAPLEVPWSGPAFASLHARAAQAFGFAADGEEYRLEALAHVAGEHADTAPLPIAFRGDRLEVGSDVWSSIAGAVGSNGSRASIARTADLARRVQTHLGRVLLEFIRDIKARFGGTHLCLGGGLFFNSYLTTTVARSGLFERTFVPVNPGNAGVAVGAAVGAAARLGAPCLPQVLSPFLGPQFSDTDIKATLDNCKLSYDYTSSREAIQRAAEMLMRGKLVAWYQGRMEWGARALGNRSIVASPMAPFVLENLNGFLKQREPHRSYSVAVSAEDAPRFFKGPASSDFMEYEFEVLDRDMFRGLLPLEATTLRVQTVPSTAGRFYELLKAFGQLTGAPVLVNTSFNGFNEPIVCTPRDAVRVFYGTGLDMAVISNFILQK